MDSLRYEETNELEELEQRNEMSEQVLRERETNRQGKKDYYDLRKHWSLFLFIFLFLSTIFQITLTLLLGYGYISFVDNKVFLYMVIGENFLQIVGMCLIVVRFLFPSNQPTPNSKQITPPPFQQNSFSNLED